MLKLYLVSAVFYYGGDTCLLMMLRRVLMNLFLSLLMLAHIVNLESAEENPDTVLSRLNDYSFASRRQLCGVLKLCCLVLEWPRLRIPVGMISLSECGVSSSVGTSVLTRVQSYIVSSNYKQGAFLTLAAMDSVRNAIAESPRFMGNAAFDTWMDICLSDRGSFGSR